jgi:hypothetical protein
LTVWPRRSDAPESDEDDLVTLADVPRPDVRGYPEVFEYAEFNGEPWEYVHTSKQLFVRLVNELCAIDEAMVESSSLGRLVAAERTPHVSYEKLENGKWVYTGLWHSYMLRAVESALADFGLEGKLRVKLAAPLDE